ncbi:Raffinose synthase, partial [Cynara cardunculus var. scolymus]
MVQDCVDTFADNAFYTEVTSEGVKLGFESFNKGGISLIFLIIDDVWQTIGIDPSSVEAKADNSAKEPTAREQGGAKIEERSSPTTSNQRPSLASSEIKMSTTCLELQILLEMEMLLSIVILAVFTVVPIKKLSGEVSFAPI